MSVLAVVSQDIHEMPSNTGIRVQGEESEVERHLMKWPGFQEYWHLKLLLVSSALSGTYLKHIHTQNLCKCFFFRWKSSWDVWEWKVLTVQILFDKFAEKYFYPFTVCTVLLLHLGFVKSLWHVFFPSLQSNLILVHLLHPPQSKRLPRCAFAWGEQLCAFSVESIILSFVWATRYMN